MFITKTFLPRRTFLRGVGATLALPLLDAMVPALSAMAKTAANPAPRLGFVFIPMGTSYPYWTPKTVGAGFEITPILTPLAPFRDQLLVLSGLDHRAAESWGDGDGDHVRGAANWLTGVHIKKSDTNVLNGTSADQLAAPVLGKETPLESLQITCDPPELFSYCSSGYNCAYSNTFSWRTPTMPLSMEGNPRIVFEQLFGEGGTAAQQRTRLQDDRSILDSLTAELNHFQRRLGPADRTKVTEYVEAIRDLERRVHKAEAQHDERLVSVSNPPAETPAEFEEYVKLMFDLQVLAWQADITRVITMQMVREQSLKTYPNIGVYEPHHPLSHHAYNPEKLANLAKLNTYHLSLLAYFIGKLRATPEGDGNLLDHAMILYGSGLGDSHKHDHLNLPTLLIGGGCGRVQGGRHLRYPNTTPMTNLLMGMLTTAGVPVEKIGDSTGSLELA